MEKGENINDKLKFEGEYLYSFKIRGKFYINEKLDFEGVYLNGKGKEYYINGKLLF